MSLDLGSKLAEAARMQADGKIPPHHQQALAALIMGTLRAATAENAANKKK